MADRSDDGAPAADGAPATRSPPPGRLARLGPMQWALLLALTAPITWLMERVGVTSALFLGPMAAGLIFGLGGSDLKVPRKVMSAAQAVIGFTLAGTLDARIFAFVGAHAPAIGAAISITAAASCLVASALLRFTPLSSQTAAWGSMPGGASIMVNLASEGGGDVRLVAFMQYVRLIIVLCSASLVATALIGAAGASGASAPATDPASIGWTEGLPGLAAVVVGMALGRICRLPAGVLLVTAVIGLVGKATGLIPLALPPGVGVLAYGAIGCYVGLQFDRPSLGAAFRALPALVAATLALLAICAVAGVVLALMMKTDLLTGYLATTPGGIDTIAIIGLHTHADMSVVMAVQTLRLFAIILAAPYLVKLICWLGPRT